MKAPTVVKRVEPNFSRVPKNFQYNGIVVVQVVIDETGTPTNVKAVRGQPELTGPAVAAVKQWKFRPGTLNGRPVPVIFNVAVHPHFW